MPSILNPYLGFADNARQAMEFYKSVFGGELTVSTFGEGGMPHDPAEAKKVMHAQLRSPGGFVLMGSDTPASMGAPRGNGAISLSGDDESELSTYWRKLSEGGAVRNASSWLEPTRRRPPIRRAACGSRTRFQQMRPPIEPQATKIGAPGDFAA